MTKEDRELLFKDLSARLPYGVKCQVEEDEYAYIGTLCRIEIDNKNELLLDFAESISGLDCQVYLSEIKPFLFPMSSMTPEQLFEVQEILGKDDVKIEEDLFRIVNHERDAFSYEEIQAVLDWFYKNHFDVFKLIPKGLAKDATNLGISIRRQE